MANPTLNILFIGDIVRKSGLELVEERPQGFPGEIPGGFPSFVNGENLVEGKGINEEYAKRVFDLGVT